MTSEAHLAGELEQRSGVARLRALVDGITADTGSTYHVPALGVLAHRPGHEAVRVFSGRDAKGTPLTADTPYPSACLSKLALTLLTMRFLENGEIALDQPLRHWLPEASGGTGELTLLRLLTHTSGLPLDLDIPYSPGLTRADVRRACLRVTPNRAPGEQVSYSNVGFGLVALILESITRRRLEELLEEFVFAPLHLEAWLGREPARSPAWVSDVRSNHTGTDIEPANSPFWRSLALPWTGLLLTPAAMLTLMRQFCPEDRFLIGPGTLESIVTNCVGSLSGGFPEGCFFGYQRAPALEWSPCPWGLGLEIRGQKRPHPIAPSFGTGSYGHVGSSGCLAWRDTTTRTSIVIVGTRSVRSGWLIRKGSRLCDAAVAAFD